MVHSVKRIALLGSTGSIGQQTLEIVRAFPDRFDIISLACEKNIGLLEKQVAEFKPRYINAESPSSNEISSGVIRLPIEELSAHPDVDIVVVATSGRAGLNPTLSAIAAGKTIALSNKEVLVMAGEIVMSEAKRRRVSILPVDSEHSAIWQCIRGEENSEVSRIILTASGGPFRLFSPARLKNVTPEDALNHPTWQMGDKVTIDSATLMNKGMEVIEAHWLFNITFQQIDVIIHPQSIIHSMVEFIDGSTKAQLSTPDMRLPIQYALTYPERWKGQPELAFDLINSRTLEFEAVDLNRYPCLKLAIEVGEKGGTYPAVLSAADEIAVELFLAGKIGFTDIASLVYKTLDHHDGIDTPSLDDILAVDLWARKYAGSAY